jgi:gas vesicle structural protein
MTVQSPTSFGDQEHISLCETLDRVLNKGVVIVGEVVISVADIDLIYLGLQLVLTSVETARPSQLSLEPLSESQE